MILESGPQVKAKGLLGSVVLAGDGLLLHAAFLVR